MSMEGDPHEQIARLEHELEALGESAAWCRKIALAARIAIGAGCVLFAAMLIGLLYPDGLRLLIATILTMGGIVLYGSNRTTANQIAARTADAERLRAELIGGIDGTFKGNRHIVFPDNVQRCSNMLLSILDLYGIHRDSLGDSTGRLPGLA